MPDHDIVAIGASAGGVDALAKLVAALADDFPAAVFVVLHVPPEPVSMLPQILSRAGPLRAAHAEDREPIEPGRIYVAPPDRHLLLKQGFVSVMSGPKENRHRPAIDPLFRTAARMYSTRVIGVLLTGAGDDGVVGLREIKTRGGIVVVQDPADAAQPDLPTAAIDFVQVDHIAPIADIAALLNRLVREPAGPQPAGVNPRLQKEARIAEVDLETIEDDDKVGTPSAFACPDCGGVLWELEGDMLRFRCRVGHSYTANALAEEHDGSLEKGLWVAFRILEENAAFSRRLAARARRAGHTVLAERFLSRAEEALAHATTIRRIILRTDRLDVEELTSE